MITELALGIIAIFFSYRKGQWNALETLVKHHTTGAIWDCVLVTPLTSERKRPGPRLITLGRGTGERITICCEEPNGIKEGNLVQLRLKSEFKKYWVLLQKRPEFKVMFIPERYLPPKEKVAV